jgi:D-3-phosphoglycerate dehydrogenase
MLLCLFNHINTADIEVRHKIWKREANRGIELMGMTVGIIGYGNMGSSVAKRLSGFGVKVLAYDKYKSNFSDQYAQEATLEELFEQVDVLSLHVPLTSETKMMVNTDFINSFQKPFFLVNTARGEVASVCNIVEALNSGQLRGACLDVLEKKKCHNSVLSKKVITKHFFRKRMSFLRLTSVDGLMKVMKINEVLIEKIKKAHPHNSIEVKNLKHRRQFIQVDASDFYFE